MKYQISFALFALLFCSSLMARKQLVTNEAELNAALHSAAAGDTILLKSGEWKNLKLVIRSKGLPGKPIVIAAEKKGKTLLTGESQLALGGDYVEVSGLFFTKGYAPSGNPIEFRASKNELANHCRVTDCVIDNFNKPKRMDEDNWISFYGRNNRLDHCSFIGKKNMGVLLAVILDDDRSRQNFHSIDHNYFGRRPPLGSNGGEIIRVGVSQHCQFASNTQIRNNFFEYCDGETEIVSIKSGFNVVDGNVFRECQGSVVLRHGDNNTVTNNLFLGNNKTATGGVRVINKGQWVINNFFYGCRGESFRSPLAVMNGIPNSPAHRYVQVTDAVIMNNSFVDCAPISFGEGSDAERTLPPSNVLFAKNIFYNTHDTAVYQIWDALDGFRFSDNFVSPQYEQAVASGFTKKEIAITRVGNLIVPFAGRGTNRIGIDSLQQIDKARMPAVTTAPGFSGILAGREAKMRKDAGASWYRTEAAGVTAKNIGCSDAASIYSALKNANGPLNIQLTGSVYRLDRPIIISSTVRFFSRGTQAVRFEGNGLPSLFQLAGNAALTIENLRVNGENLQAAALIASDSSGYADHFSCSLRNVEAMALTGCGSLLLLHKSMIADSIRIINSSFTNFGAGILMNEERDDKGYYNAEKIFLDNNRFSNGNGALILLYRGGNDESTLGPDLRFIHNRVENCNNPSGALIELTGIQKTRILLNQFIASNRGALLIRYRDTVRAAHLLQSNRFSASGSLDKNTFVTDQNNNITQ